MLLGYWLVKRFVMPGLLLVMGSSCKKWVQVDPPDDWLEAGTIFSNDSMANKAITGIYIRILSNTKYVLNGGMSVFPALSSDELTRTSSLTNEDQLLSCSLLPGNLLINTNLWKAAYAYIYQCNIGIEGLQQSTGVSAALKKRLTGEMYFVRALCYFYLVNMWGDVPLAVSTNAEVNAVLPRSPVAEVYRQIVADLQSAHTLLTDNNANTVPSAMACQALQARVYLYLQHWSNAEIASSVVINSGRYNLANDPDSVFLSNSTETIFQWAPVLSGINSPEGRVFIPTSAAVRPTYAITPELLNAFESGDLRKTSWVKSSTINTQTWYYPFKYKVNSSSGAVTEYNVVLRLAEQYLVRAEAAARQNQIGRAVADINIIRARAGLPALPDTISQDQCLAAIEQERRVELFTEWGHRWFDLKRTNRANAILGIVKGSSWQPTDQLYPIPVSEIQANPHLAQNAGY